ncbi:MAG: anhydro-N-acetylmuramic acid kinase, partial [Sphingobacterium sp.]
PLAAYGDYLLFSHEQQNRILLNIGGISNFTFLPALNIAMEAYATDLGPGNTLMNQFMFTTYGREMDLDAKIAKSGKPNQSLLNALLEDSFLEANFPKTTGPELFNLSYLEKALAKINQPTLPPQDIMATLNAFSATVIIQGIKKATLGLDSFHIYLSGGGLHNPMLVQQIHQAFSGKVFSFQELGVDPDAKEACLFAILANETIAGSPQNIQRIKDSPAVCMGKISLPY